MDLRLHLMVRIALLGLLCLVVASGVVLWQSDRDLRSASRRLADSTATLFELRIVERSAGFQRNSHELNVAQLLDAGGNAGQCIRYAAVDGSGARNSCHGWQGSGSPAPAWFAFVFQRMFEAGREVTRAVRFRGVTHGEVTVTPDPSYAVARAWDDIRPMLGLSAGTVSALCLLTWFVIGRALRPTREVLDTLAELARGDLGRRLPTFSLIELRRISDGVNTLAARLEENVAARERLTQELIRVQEEERRSLAHELHDEFGQCLAALNAMASVIGDAAEQQVPEAAAQARRMTGVIDRMMRMLKGMLFRLRPAGIDDLGLPRALETLVTGWNASTGGRTRFELAVRGDLHLPEPIGVSVYRIVQECLTNTSKHAEAHLVQVTVARLSDTGVDGDRVDVQVEDDGVADHRALLKPSGLGLLGIRERVAALGGLLTIESRATHGLAVRASIPLPAPSTAS